MSRNKTFSLDINCEDALSELIHANSEDWVLGRISQKAILESISEKEAIEHFGEESLLSHMSTDVIEEEYLKRSPLGRALE